MNALLIELTLNSPVLLSKVQAGDANTAKTLAHIPGSAIRGMLINRHLKGKLGTLQTGDDFYELFFSGKLRFLNAYPCHGERREPARGLPIPLSLKSDKDDEETIYDLAIAERDSAELAKKGLSGFVSQDISVKVPMHEQMRVHIDRGNRQTIRKDGQNTVFGYQSLAAGQIYQAVILGNADDLNRLKQLVDAMPNTLLGKSSQAEYGRVGLKARIVSDWIEYKKRDEESDAKIWVTALSPWLIRDPKTGGYSNSPLPIFGIEHCPAVSFVRTEVVGGFNRAWGLPLPQQMAIQAGSVFAYPNSPELLEKLKGSTAKLAMESWGKA
jgi:CRISPR-associated protein Csx10